MSKFERKITVYDLNGEFSAVECVEMCICDQDDTVFHLDSQVYLCLQENARMIEQELRSEFGKWRKEVQDSDNLQLLEDLQ